MDTLREKREVKGIGVSCFKQSETNILCKLNLTPSDAKCLCDRTKSGLYKYKELHERVMNMIVTRLDDVFAQETTK